MNPFARTEMLLGSKAMQTLEKATVVIFGIGGVGSYVAEGLVRAGIGNFILIDNDMVSETNLNRQIIATTETIGKPKVEVMKKRMITINPKANIQTIPKFYLPGKEEIEIGKEVDYIVDAIDTITAKIGLVEIAKKREIPIISSMGTGNKIEPTKLKVADIYETKICPLAKIMRKELRKRNVDALKVVYSEEEPIKIAENTVLNQRKQVPGSISFVPSVAGLIISAEVIKDILAKTL